MEYKTKIFAGGHPLTIGHGTRVILAGKPMFLPDRNTPIVVQRLTAHQIAAIPKDRYAVAVIEPTGKATAIPATRTGRGLPVPRRLQQRRYIERVRRLVGRRGNILPSVNSDGTQEFNTVIALLGQISHHVETIYIENRELSRNQTNPPPSDSGIFYPPIDEGKLSDCIKLIVNRFFGNDDKVKILGTEIKVGEFCLLTHCYFRRIKIMKNEALKPFCDYLEKKVFPEESKFTARTFNNYANDPNFMNAKDGFIDSEKLKINFNNHPVPCGKLLDVFHEVGWNFHHSDYFDELREMRKRIDEFKI